MWLKIILKITAYQEGHNVLGVLCKMSSELIQAVQMLSLKKTLKIHIILIFM